MINFSKIKNNTLWGIFLRTILKFIPNDFVMRIVQGPLIGKKWIKGSGVSGYWLGTCELEKQKYFLQFIQEGDVVYDIGAHVGFYTLFAAQLVGEKGKVFAFEPDERNFLYLERNIKLNKESNVEVIKSAVSDYNGKLFFRMGENTSSGSITKVNTGAEVLSITVDKFVQTQNCPPNFMKIDVEGAEALVLLGSLNTIKKYFPKIFVAIHSREAYRECKKIFDEVNYKLVSTGEENEVAGEYIAIYNKFL